MRRAEDSQRSQNRDLGLLFEVDDVTGQRLLNPIDGLNLPNHEAADFTEVGPGD